ncbi:class II fructose-bisphosphate aldolase [Streptomyces hygroscopicus]|uniref:class II fructose-bisphosphate aldolase n=1 Tax=Streptomyces hygroscopicus TaxID=1912 RepID=UPI0007DB583A|nr:class II fructose-bisphosphate aldolase [Streptomyces sp. NBRC 109436]
MPLAHPADLLPAARAARTGVGAFNVITIEHAQAVVRSAEEARLPVFVQLSENAVRYHDGIEPLAAACRELARAASVPIVLHLDHATSSELCRRAVDAGFSSVMFDASTLPYQRNVTATAEVVAWAHQAGVWVEAELGAIGGKDGAHAPGARTVPHEAADFVAATGVDSLAVAIGTSHAMRERSARIDLDLLDALYAEVPVPLVLHGSSGLSDERIAQAVAHGITKVNVGTQLNQAFTAALRHVLEQTPDVTDPRRYLRSARTAVGHSTLRLIRTIAGPAAARP